MDIALGIVFGLACAFIGVVVIAVPMRARVLELVTERDLWRSRALNAEGYEGHLEDSDVNVIPQPPREHGLDAFFGREGGTE
jgi:hypothetical protein